VKIAVLPGDGIGKEVTAEAVKVLRAVVGNELPLDLEEGVIGEAGLQTVGDSLPP
jgi:3-isopropylmalate dehydrogenase